MMMKMVAIMMVMMVIMMKTVTVMMIKIAMKRMLEMTDNKDDGHDHDATLTMTVMII